METPTHSLAGDQPGPLALPERAWRLKAHAFLLPTPLLALDPTGEDAREERVKDLLKLGALSEREHALLERCHADASLAQAGEDVSPQALRAQLQHPLDPRQRSPLPRVVDASREWHTCLDEFSRRCASPQGTVNEGAGRAWRLLWHTFMTGAPRLGQIPHSHNVPDHSALAHRSLKAALVGARYDTGTCGGEAALLLVQLGGVQEFIEASRRTHDLWGGSYVVSYLSFQALRHLCSWLGPDCIVTPFPGDLALARLTLFEDIDVSRAGRVQPSLPAKIMAVVPAICARALGEEATSAARAWWLAMGEEVRAALCEELKGKHEGWDNSLREHLETFLDTSWMALPWPQDPERAKQRLRAAGWGEELPQEAEVAALWGPLTGLLWQGMSAHRKGRLPNQPPGDCRPKCTVCGEREQLGPKPPPEPNLPGEGLEEHRDFWRDLNTQLTEHPDREGLQISDGEGLCGVCLTRRFAPERWFGTQKAGLGLDWENKKDRPLLRYPSVPSVATAPFRLWMDRCMDPRVEGLRKDWAEEVGLLHNETHLNFTPPGNLLPGLGRLGQVGGRPWLGFDGSWLDIDAYEPRRVWRDHTGRNPTRAEPRWMALGEPLLKAWGSFKGLCQALKARPCHYVAVLYLDGDKMSLWLNGAHPYTPRIYEVKGEALPPQGHKEAPKRPVYPALQAEVSRRLSGLATGPVGKLVHEHLGRLVYCGGDDVLALLPVATALPCAWSIAKLFRDPDHLGARVGASAGIAIVPMRDPLGGALRAARDMERKAKKLSRCERERDEEDRGQGAARPAPLPYPMGSVGIRVEVRSGDPLEVVLPWQVGSEIGGTGQVGAAPLFQQLIARDEAGDLKVNLDLGHALRQELSALGEMPQAFEARLRHLLGRGQGGGGSEAQLAVDALVGATGGDPETIATALLIARFLAREEGGIPTAELLAALPELEEEDR